MIKGSSELIKSLQSNLTEIDKDIEQLNKNIDELTNKIDKKNEFKIETIKKNKAIQSEVNMLKTALNGALKKREQLMQDNAGTAYKDVNELLRAYKVECKTSTNDKNIAIIDKLEEIKQLSNDIQEMDQVAFKEIQQFIEQVKPYLDKEPKQELILYGGATTQYDYLTHSNSATGSGQTTFVNKVSEYSLNTKNDLYGYDNGVKVKLKELKESYK